MLPRVVRCLTLARAISQTKSIVSIELLLVLLILGKHSLNFRDLPVSRSVGLGKSQNYMLYDTPEEKGA